MNIAKNVVSSVILLQPNQQRFTRQIRLKYKPYVQLLEGRLAGATWVKVCSV